MKALEIKKNNRFVGSKHEVSKIHDICESNEASILIVYGRRRVGKTELIEQTLRERNILKFEGIEGLDEGEQIKRSLWKLAEYTEVDRYAEPGL